MRADIQFIPPPWFMYCAFSDMTLLRKGKNRLYINVVYQIIDQFVILNVSEGSFFRFKDSSFSTENDRITEFTYFKHNMNVNPGYHDHIKKSKQRLQRLIKPIEKDLFISLEYRKERTDVYEEWYRS